MADIFISYASEDRSWVEPLVKALEAQGWSVFWDRRIPAGKTWRQVIGNALETARAVIVAWSKTSVKSTWVQEEADWGLKRKILIPILIDDVSPPLGFSSVQTAKLISWNPSKSSPEFDNFISDISAILDPHPNKAEKKPDKPESVNVKRSKPQFSVSHKTSKVLKFGAVAGVIVLLIVGIWMYISKSHQNKSPKDAKIKKENIVDKRAFLNEFNSCNALFSKFVVESNDMMQKCNGKTPNYTEYGQEVKNIQKQMIDSRKRILKFLDNNNIVNQRVRSMLKEFVEKSNEYIHKRNLLVKRHCNSPGSVEEREWEEADDIIVRMIKLDKDIKKAPLYRK